MKFYGQIGTQTPGTMNVTVAGQFIDQDSRVIDVKGTLMVNEWVKSEKSSDPKDYWVTHTWYPNQWEVIFENMVPEDIRHFIMTPIVQGGQTGYNASGAQYSEGGVYLKDPDGKLLGKGFAESVYYADAHPNMFHLSGLPDTQKMQELVKPQSPSAILKLKGFLYFLRSSRRMRLKNILEKCIEQGLPTSFIE